MASPNRDVLLSGNYIPDFDDLVKPKNVKYLISNFYIEYIVEW